jgi:hypothetical protein
MRNGGSISSTEICHSAADFPAGNTGLLGQNTEMPGKMTGKQCPIAGSLLPRMSNTVPTPRADISFDRVRHDFSTT